MKPNTKNKPRPFILNRRQLSLQHNIHSLFYSTSSPGGSASSFSSASEIVEGRRTHSKDCVWKRLKQCQVSEGYIATGSETNEVFVYQKTFPTSALLFKFNSADPSSGGEVDDDTAKFISSVCWRGKSSTLVAADSMGNIMFW